MIQYHGSANARISLCNAGDTDYYINLIGWGCVINATLTTLSYTSIVKPKRTPYINYRYINSSSKKGVVARIDDLSKTDEYNSFVIETIKAVNPRFTGNIEIITNIPERSGLGGSSAFIVSLIKALTQTTQQPITNPDLIARMAYKIERERLGIKGGYQDQYSASYGGFNYMVFGEGKVDVFPLGLSTKCFNQIERNLYLFLLREREVSGSNTHSALEQTVRENQEQMKQIMLERRGNVQKAKTVIMKGDIVGLANLIKREQELKEMTMGGNMSPEIKRLMGKAMNYGALAGKISGAGPSGCGLFVYNGNKPEEFVRKMEGEGCKRLMLQLSR